MDVGDGKNGQDSDVGDGGDDGGDDTWEEGWDEGWDETQDDDWPACPGCGHEDRVAAQSFEALVGRLLRQRPHCREWVPDAEGWSQTCGCEHEFHAG
ncbi:hypothetical protein [Nocardioides abyssi]|uniref:Uncharacterized protein n=1 Tax=Nocardioides abyssi TaxID=3058370 RepID=A0ABT8EUY7_9ACTN|nr:hypothetical protein [Nocardioides abyssi]MDN4161927.1 hypothetical protein [Nocardioides abyssi]